MIHTAMTLTRTMSKPGPRAMEQRKTATRYLKDTILIDITYNEGADDGGNLVAYVNADHMQGIKKTVTPQQEALGCTWQGPCWTGSHQYRLS